MQFLCCKSELEEPLKVSSFSSFFSDHQRNLLTAKPPSLAFSFWQPEGTNKSDYKRLSDYMKCIAIYFHSHVGRCHLFYSDRAGDFRENESIKLPEQQLQCVCQGEGLNVGIFINVEKDSNEIEFCFFIQTFWNMYSIN